MSRRPERGGEGAGDLAPGAAASADKELDKGETIVSYKKHNEHPAVAPDRHRAADAVEPSGPGVASTPCPGCRAAEAHGAPLARPRGPPRAVSVAGPGGSARRRRGDACSRRAHRRHTPASA